MQGGFDLRLLLKCEQCRAARADLELGGCEQILAVQLIPLQGKRLEMAVHETRGRVGEVVVLITIIPLNARLIDACRAADGMCSTQSARVTKHGRAGRARLALEPVAIASYALLADARAELRPGRTAVENALHAQSRAWGAIARSRTNLAHFALLRGCTGGAQSKANARERSRQCERCTSPNLDIHVPQPLWAARGSQGQG